MSKRLLSILLTGLCYAPQTTHGSDRVSETSENRGALVALPNPTEQEAGQFAELDETTLKQRFKDSVDSLIRQAEQAQSVFFDYKSPSDHTAFNPEINSIQESIDTILAQNPDIESYLDEIIKAHRSFMSGSRISRSMKILAKKYPALSEAIISHPDIKATNLNISLSQIIHNHFTSEDNHDNRELSREALNRVHNIASKSHEYLELAATASIINCRDMATRAFETAIETAVDFDQLMQIAHDADKFKFRDIALDALGKTFECESHSYSSKDYTHIAKVAVKLEDEEAAKKALRLALTLSSNDLADLQSIVNLAMNISDMECSRDALDSFFEAHEKNNSHWGVIYKKAKEMNIPNIGMQALALMPNSAHTSSDFSELAITAHELGCSEMVEDALDRAYELATKGFEYNFLMKASRITNKTEMLARAMNIGIENETSPKALFALALEANESGYAEKAKEAFQKAINTQENPSYSMLIDIAKEAIKAGFQDIAELALLKAIENSTTSLDFSAISSQAKLITSTEAKNRIYRAMFSKMSGLSNSVNSYFLLRDKVDASPFEDIIGKILFKEMRKAKKCSDHLEIVNLSMSSTKYIAFATQSLRKAFESASGSLDYRNVKEAGLSLKEKLEDTSQVDRIIADAERKIEEYKEDQIEEIETLDTALMIIGMMGTGIDKVFRAGGATNYSNYEEAARLLTNESIIESFKELSERVYNADDIEAAKIILTRAYEIKSEQEVSDDSDSCNPFNFTEIAKLAKQFGFSELAITVIEKALEKNDYYSDCFIIMAEIAHELNRSDLAEKALQHALERSENHYNIWLAKAASQAEYPEMVKKALDKAAKMAVNKPEIALVIKTALETDYTDFLDLCSCSTFNEHLDAADHFKILLKDPKHHAKARNLITDIINNKTIKDPKTIIEAAMAANEIGHIEGVRLALDKAFAIVSTSRTNPEEDEILLELLSPTIRSLLEIHTMAEIINYPHMHSKSYDEITKMAKQHGVEGFDIANFILTEFDLLTLEIPEDLQATQDRESMDDTASQVDEERVSVQEDISADDDLLEELALMLQDPNLPNQYSDGDGAASAGTEEAPQTFESNLDAKLNKAAEENASNQAIIDILNQALEQAQNLDDYICVAKKAKEQKYKEIMPLRPGTDYETEGADFMKYKELTALALQKAIGNARNPVDHFSIAMTAHYALDSALTSEIFENLLAANNEDLSAGICSMVALYSYEEKLSSKLVERALKKAYELCKNSYDYSLLDLVISRIDDTYTFDSNLMQKAFEVANSIDDYIYIAINYSAEGSVKITDKYGNAITLDINSLTRDYSPDGFTLPCGLGAELEDTDLDLTSKVLNFNRKAEWDNIAVELALKGLSLEASQFEKLRLIEVLSSHYKLHSKVVKYLYHKASEEERKKIADYSQKRTIDLQETVSDEEMSGLIDDRISKTQKDISLLFLGIKAIILDFPELAEKAFAKAIEQMSNPGIVALILKYSNNEETKALAIKKAEELKAETEEHDETKSSYSGDEELDEEDGTDIEKTIANTSTKMPTHLDPSSNTGAELDGADSDDMSDQYTPRLANNTDGDGAATSGEHRHVDPLSESYEQADSHMRDIPEGSGVQINSPVQSKAGTSKENDEWQSGSLTRAVPPLQSLPTGQATSAAQSRVSDTTGDDGPASPSEDRAATETSISTSQLLEKLDEELDAARQAQTTRNILAKALLEANSTDDCLDIAKKAHENKEQETLKTALNEAMKKAQNEHDVLAVAIEADNFNERELGLGILRTTFEKDNSKPRHSPHSTIAAILAYEMGDDTLAVTALRKAFTNAIHSADYMLLETVSQRIGKRNIFDENLIDKAFEVAKIFGDYQNIKVILNGNTTWYVTNSRLKIISSRLKIRNHEYNFKKTQKTANIPEIGKIETKAALKGLNIASSLLEQLTLIRLSYIYINLIDKIIIDLYNNADAELKKKIESELKNTFDLNQTVSREDILTELNSEITKANKNIDFLMLAILAQHMDQKELANQTFRKAMGDGNNSEIRALVAKFAQDPEVKKAAQEL